MYIVKLHTCITKHGWGGGRKEGKRSSVDWKEGSSKPNCSGLFVTCVPSAGGTESASTDPGSTSSIPYTLLLQHFVSMRLRSTPLPVYRELVRIRHSQPCNYSIRPDLENLVSKLILIQRVMELILTCST